MNEMTNSHILVNEFEYVEAASLADAVAVLAEHGHSAKVLAGGTDLLVSMKLEHEAPAVVVSIRKVPGLAEVAFRDGALHIGAMGTIKMVRENTDVQARFSALADAGLAFSTIQVESMGTVGGNLCNGSPGAETAPSLIAFGAHVIIQGPAGTRSMPVGAFFKAPGRTALEQGELLAEIVVPEPPAGTGSAFMKVSRVAAAMAKETAAVVVVRDGSKIVSCKIAFGSVGPTPMRTPKAEAMLEGQIYDQALLEMAAHQASEEIQPRSSARSTAWYRRQIASVLVQDAFGKAWERAATPGCPSDLACLARDEQSDQVNRSMARGNGNGHGATGVSPAHGVRRFADDEPGSRRVEIVVNGVKRRLWVAPNELLLSVLRERLELTGAKYGCGIGECSACTVRMDGKPVLACLVLAVSADGCDVQTVEGLQKPDGQLDPLQQQFIEQAAFQCGFCTAGMLMTAKSLLTEVAHPSETQVRDYMKGNLCRCTGYSSIVRAIMRSAETETVV